MTRRYIDAAMAPTSCLPHPYMYTYLCIYTNYIYTNTHTQGWGLVLFLYLSGHIIGSFVHFLPWCPNEEKATSRSCTANPKKM